jgi:glucose-6-phosphate 1-epimerase
MGVEVQICYDGMKKLTLKNAVASAEIFTHGAHIVSWKNASGDELIFVSDKAIYKPPKAIRGGIPICFPQFGDFGPCETQHGFARNSEWTLESDVSEDTTEVVLSLSSSEATLKVYPHTFKLKLTVKLSTSGNLITTFHAVNNGTSTMPITFALHTYFATPDISQVQEMHFKFK